MKQTTKAGVNAVVKSIMAKLDAISDVTNALAKDKYFKNVIKHKGVTTPCIDKAVKDEIMNNGTFDELNVDEKLRVAEGLLKSEYAEDKHASWLVLDLIHKQMTTKHIDSIKEIFKQGYVANWGTCDCLSKPIRKWTLLSEKNTRYLMTDWSKEKECLWVRRCCCVSQVTRARKGDEGNFVGYMDLLFESSERVVHYNQRFNQLGVGWMLREMYLAQPKRTISFLEKHYSLLTREALRYAIEKMTPAEKRRLLAFGNESSNDDDQSDETSDTHTNDNLDSNNVSSQQQIPKTNLAVEKGIKRSRKRIISSQESQE